MDSFIRVKSNSAVVLKRKKPFIDWIRSLDEEETDIDDFKEEDFNNELLEEEEVVMNNLI